MKRKIAGVLLTVMAGMCCSAVAFADGTPTLSVESEIFGTVFNTAANQTVDYGDTCAILTLEMDDIDDSKIDSSNATVSLAPGDGYYTEEFIFSGTALTGEWENGQLIYTLSSDDLVYKYSDKGAGWTPLGGDGAGNYAFNLKVEGILYDGEPVEAQTFRIQVYAYGRDFKADAIDLYGEEPETVTATQTALDTDLTAEAEPVWVWVGEDEVDSEIPILCDDNIDNFYVIWPDGTDVSSLDAQDVIITLKSEYGDEKVLTPEEDYVLFDNDGMTQIAITYQNLPFIPVYSTMSIEINGEEAVASAEYDIASVYVYYTMFGGQTGARRGWLFYGFDLDILTDPQQLLRPVLYALQLEDTEQYYSEENGLVDSVEEATIYNGQEQRDVSLDANYISLYQLSWSIYPMYEEKEIDGETYSFVLNFDIASSGLYSPAALLTERQEDTTWYPADEYPVPDVLPGYTIAWYDTGWVTMEKWAWMNGIDLGWRTINVQYEDGEIVYTNKAPTIELEKGTEEQFLTPDITDETVTWSIYGDDISGTTIDENGLLTIPADETASSITVWAQTDDPYGDGLVNVTLVDPEE
ncbi:MAG: hypothetical protein LUF30_09670 [Lachnospiraceae bacterium]|nr:hypothetical protein [Lachnospiraceae bacterium]